MRKHAVHVPPRSTGSRRPRHAPPGRSTSERSHTAQVARQFGWERGVARDAQSTSDLVSRGVTARRRRHHEEPDRAIGHHGDELALAQRSPVRPLTVLHRTPVTHRRTRTRRRISTRAVGHRAGEPACPALTRGKPPQPLHVSSRTPGRHHPTRSPQQGSSPEPPDTVQAHRPSRYSPGAAGHTQSTSPPRTFGSHRPKRAAPRGSSAESSDTEQESWRSQYSRGAARDTPSTSLTPHPGAIARSRRVSDRIRSGTGHPQMTRTLQWSRTGAGAALRHREQYISGFTRLQPHHRANVSRETPVTAGRFTVLSLARPRRRQSTYAQARGPDAGCSLYSHNTTRKADGPRTDGVVTVGLRSVSGR